MNRLFEESLGRARPREAALLGGGWAPLADVYETAEAYLIQLELPGLKRDDVEIQVDVDALVVRGERKLEGLRPESFHRMERSYGYFSRSFRLPEHVEPDRVRAEFQDGILRLEVPKARPRATGRSRGDRPR